MKWLKSHRDVRGWVVLEDLDLHNDLIEKHQVKTNPMTGLTLEDTAKAEEILKSVKDAIPENK